MNASIRLIGLVFTASTLVAQNQISLDYGNPSYGGRMTIAGHANFFNASATLLPDWRADVGASFESRIRANGNDRQAFYAQADLDARLRVTFGVVNGVPRNTISESMTLAGFVRVGSRTLSRSSTLEAAQDVAIPMLSFATSGSMTATVPLGGPFAATIGIGAEAEIRSTLVPAVAPTPLSVSLSVVLTGGAEGRLSVAVGVPQLGEVGVSGALDYADPSASATLSTNFQTVTRRLCLTPGTISLAFDVFVRALGFEILRVNVVRITQSLGGLRCINF